MKKAVRYDVLKIIAVNALFSCLWIYFSDTALGLFVPDTATFILFSEYKGFFFIVVNSILLYQLTSRCFLESRHLKEEIQTKNIILKSERKRTEDRINSALNYARLLYKTSPI